MKNRNKYLLLLIAVLAAVVSFGQDSLQLSLKLAVQKGVDSSKQLQLANAKIQEAIEQLGVVKSHALPQAKVSFSASEALIPTQTLQLKDVMPHPIQLPSHSTMYIGNIGVQQIIFGGNKIRYAKKSAALLQKVSELEAIHDQDGVMLNIVKAYVNLYEVDQNIKIIQHSIKDIQGRVEETKRFKQEGLATQNDVLRFQLEVSKMKIAMVNLQNNRKIANFTLVTLLNLPANTIIKEEDVSDLSGSIQKLDLQDLITKASSNREDLKTFEIRQKMSEIQLKNINGEKLPTLGAGVNAYYLNPNDRFIPEAHTFLFPISIGLNLSWNISSLYTSKHKEAKAKIQQQEIQIAKEATQDKISLEVSREFRQYQTAVQKIDLLKTSVAQAKENDRIMEQKYQNQLATTTDRIDAQTLYYKALIDLSIAKAESIKAWYNLQASMGMLKSEF